MNAFFGHIKNMGHLKTESKRARIKLVKVEKSKKKKGRTRKMDTRARDTAIRMAQIGLNDRQISHSLAVTPQTLGYHKHDPDFFEPFKEARKKADTRVIESLYQRCLGYTFPEEKLFLYGKTGEVLREVVMTHIPPDIRAIRFWLVNRHSEEWKPDVGIHVNNTNTSAVQISNVVKPEEVTDAHKSRIKDNIGIIQRYGILDSKRST